MRVERTFVPEPRSPKYRGRTEPALRLDLVGNPFGPCPAALEAHESLQNVPLDALIGRLRVLIGKKHRVAVDDIVVCASIDGVLHRMVSNWDGPVVVFPPSVLAGIVSRAETGRETLAIARGPLQGNRLNLDSVTDLPANALAVVDSPSNPLGGLLTPVDAVRLARACRLVIIDERHAEIAGFSLLDLSGEFENIVVLRSFENWARIENPPCSWAVFRAGSTKLFDLEHGRPEREAVAGAIATLENPESVEMTMRLLREERSRLYRFLRKLSFLEPVPSWGPFMSARVTMVARNLVVNELAARGVCVHAPDEPGLERMIRIGLESRTSMDRLRQALLDIAPRVVA